MPSWSITWLTSPVTRIVTGPDETCRRPAEGLEQAQLVEPPVRHRREARELGENALARWARHQRRITTDELLGGLVEPKAELVLEPHGPQKPERVVGEHPV